MKIREKLYIVAGLIILFALLKQCENDPIIKIETKTITKIVTDTIVKTNIVEVEKKVYVEKFKDSIVFTDKPSETTTTATQYKTKLESNNATADIVITSLGEVLNVQGTITYPEKEIITNITKTKNASGLFVYGSTAINNFNSAEVGLMYQFKNTVGVMAGVNYNIITTQPELRVGILIKL